MSWRIGVDLSIKSHYTTCSYLLRLSPGSGAPETDLLNAAAPIDLWLIAGDMGHPHSTAWPKPFGLCGFVRKLRGERFPFVEFVYL